MIDEVDVRAQTMLIGSRRHLLGVLSCPFQFSAVEAPQNPLLQTATLKAKTA
jgi:hypothetical protein